MRINKSQKKRHLIREKQQGKTTEDYCTRNILRAISKLRLFYSELGCARGWTQHQGVCEDSEESDEQVGYRYLQAVGNDW